MTPDRAKFNKEVEKGLLDRGVTIPIRAMTEQETAEQRIKIQADQIASLKRHIGRLETQLENELLVDDGSPLTPHGEAIAAGDGTLHGAIDYWQQQAFTMAAGQCCVKDGGLMSDDHGHQYCDMERQRDELKADLAAANDLLATMRPFWTKHALGPLAKPSCLCCGKSDYKKAAVEHMELPGVVICDECKGAADALAAANERINALEADLARAKARKP